MPAESLDLAAAMSTSESTGVPIEVDADVNWYTHVFIVTVSRNAPKDRRSWYNLRLLHAAVMEATGTALELS